MKNTIRMIKDDVEIRAPIHAQKELSKLGWIEAEMQIKAEKPLKRK